MEYSVSINAAGDRLAIGAYFNDGNGASSGHVRIYDWNGGSWSQIGQDIDGEAAGDKFGTYVDLSSDGNFLAEFRHNFGAGHVRIFENISGLWTQIGLNIDAEGSNDRFGNSLSLSSDGSIVAIGAFENDGNGQNTGHVRIYENVGGSWSQIGLDIDGESAGDHFGCSVSISDNGNIVAIGAYANNGNAYRSGHVRIYENVGGSWSQIGQDIDGKAAWDLSGYSVSLSSDGSIVAIGSSQIWGTSQKYGSVSIYENVGGSWSQKGQDIDGEAANDYSGYSVSQNSDGSMLAIGAYGNDANGSNSGHVRIFELSTPCADLGCLDPLALNFDPYATPW